MTARQTRGKSMFGRFSTKWFVGLHGDTRWASREDGTSELGGLLTSLREKWCFRGQHQP